MKLLKEHYFIIGIILLIVSIIYPLFKIETLGKKALLNYKLVNKQNIEASIEFRNVNILQDDISSIKNDVIDKKNKLNELVQKSYELNDKINTVFNDSLTDKTIADSLYDFYSGKLLLNEQNIDSLNSIFDAQSNVLLKKINDHSDETETHQIQILNCNEQTALLLINIGLLFVYIFLMIIGINKSLKMIRS